MNFFFVLRCLDRGCHFENQRVVSTPYRAARKNGDLMPGIEVRFLLGGGKMIPLREQGRAVFLKTAAICSLSFARTIKTSLQIAARLVVPQESYVMSGFSRNHSRRKDPVPVIHRPNFSNFKLSTLIHSLSHCF
ncbi:hypothetical protein [Tardiphaga sp. 768_D3_N2_1]|uniref:hypothetical protein n=1 Tax=Tardiphaga sp. 768_D3_N2_1 TaxID=3240783 RepID=UPI003F8B49F1